MYCLYYQNDVLLTDVDVDGDGNGDADANAGGDAELIRALLLLTLWILPNINVVLNKKIQMFYVVKVFILF